VKDQGLIFVVFSGWHKPDFNWQEYLQHCKAQAAPESYFHLVQLYFLFCYFSGFSNNDDE
jgi:hypothetical protein